MRAGHSADEAMNLVAAGYLCWMICAQGAAGAGIFVSEVWGVFMPGREVVDLRYAIGLPRRRR
ncbi:hypothetical protein [Morganella morganii]|uniref:hypothetical protein n=1 Tax=Morganella morganii TaxID=582 RepID=UPI000BFB6BFF|nr:hypothetical protein [Morganella morganii]PHH11187.1 hypothetical protein CRX48_00845 [Morganella morganii]